MNVQIRLTSRSTTYLFIHVVPNTPMPYPSPFSRCTWQHYGASIKPRVDGDAKGPIAQRQHAWKKSNSPHHSNDGPDDPIAPYRPLLHRTNLHANLPPLSAKSSARRASRQACVSLTGRLVYLNVWVYSLLCWSPLLPYCCKPQNNMAASTAYAY